MRQTIYISGDHPIVVNKIREIVKGQQNRFHHVIIPFLTLDASGFQIKEREKMVYQIDILDDGTFAGGMLPVDSIQSA